MNETSSIKSYRVQSWLILLFANLVFGAIALYYSEKTNASNEAGDIARAQISSKQTKKFLGIGLIFGVVSYVVVGFTFLFYTRNQLLLQEYQMERSWNNLISEFQIELDIISEFTNVADYNFDQELVNDVLVIKQRAEKINFEKLKKENVALLASLQTELENAIEQFINSGRTASSVQPSQRFITFQVQRSAIKNNITFARNIFNDDIIAYNRSIKIFPGSIIAKALGLQAQSPLLLKIKLN